MSKDIQARKWQVTINNPNEKQLNHKQIRETLEKLKPAVYWCMADERGLEEKTPHTHIYIVCSSPVRFSTLKKLFHGVAHLEAAKGTHQQNRDYIAKEGKWESNKKVEAKIEGSFEEWGKMPENSRVTCVEGEILARIQNGATNAEILRDFPHYLRGLRDVEYVRQTLRAEEYRDKWRDLETTYIFGETGLGKTRFVMESYGFSNVYQVNNYKHPFDGYAGESVMLFDEFCGNFRIQDMNNYLDGYPLTLPARYTNKQACYETVYIITNLELWEQYQQERLYQRSVWNAFIRRIHKVIHFLPDGTRRKYTTQEYLKQYKQVELTGLGERRADNERNGKTSPPFDPETSRKSD